MKKQFGLRSRAMRALGATTFLTTLALPGIAMAADEAAAEAETMAPAAAPDADGALGEIVVTATRKAESVQKVAISIQALTPEKLSDRQVVAFTDYVNMLPSVSFASLGPGRTNVYFRGVSGGGGNLPTTGTYLDDVPISSNGRMPDLHIYDIARVEALSGPQGTLFGASSLSGTLRIITNKADPTRFEGGYDLQINKYGKGDPGAMLEGFVNVPINDRVAVRVMGFYRHDGGYIDNKPAQLTYKLGDDDPTTNYTVDNTLIAQDDYNTVTEYGGRINMTLELSDDWTIAPSITAQYLDADGSFNYDPRFGDLTVHDFSKTENIDKWYQAALTIQGKIADFDIVSSTGYFKRKILNANDYTYYTVTYDNFGPGYESYLKFYDTKGSLIDPTQAYLGRQTQDKFTQELRIQVPEDWPFDLTVGGFYQWQRNKNDSDYYIPGLSQIDFSDPLNADSARYTAAGVIIPRAIKRDAFYLVENNTSFVDYAAFAEGSFEIVRGLKLTGGIRFFKSTNSVYGYNGVTNRTYMARCGFPLPDNDRLTCINTDIKFKGTGQTYKAAAQWQIDQSKMVYATYSTGFRPGGGNRIAPNNPYQADTLDNYEVGFKTQWGSNFRLNGSLYYEKWKGIQYGVVPYGFQGAGVTVNAGDASIYGVEVDYDLRLGSFTFAGSAAYTDAKLATNFCNLDPVLRVVQLTSCTDPAAIAAVKGTRLPRQPKFKGQMSARYGFQLGSLDAWLQGVGFYQSSSTSNLDEGNNALLGNTPGFASFDASFGVKKDDWTIEAFIQNIFDKRGQLSKNTFCSIEYCSDSSRTFPIKPQFFGMKFGKRF